MSFLAVNNFGADLTTLDTSIRIIGSAAIQAVRVKMIKHGTIADGTLTLEVLDGARSLGSATITAAEFNSITGTFAWGYWAFCFDEAIAVNAGTGVETELTIRFTMSGHTPDENNYIGLIRQFENEFVDEFGARPGLISDEQDGWYNPWGVELFTVDRGTI